MSRCPNCGLQPHGPELPCPDCGHFRMGRLSVVTGLGKFPINISTTVGRPVLRRWVGDEEAKFASEAQYRVSPDPVRGWTIEALPDTPNSTKLDGITVAPGTSADLKDGNRITIGSSRALLTIQIDRTS
jgi:hypothetical protein